MLKRRIFWIWVWLYLQCARVRDEAPVCGGRMVRFLIINLLMMIDDGDDYDDWWWWSLCSRWLLTTFFFHRKTASWPPSPGGFWPTIFFSLVIFGQRSLFVSIFPIDVKVGWTLYFVKKIFSPHCLKNDIFTVYFLICAAAAAIEDIKKVFTQGPYGVRQAYWVCRNWQRVEVPIILRLPMMSNNDGCNITIANAGQDGHDNADNIKIEILLSWWRR